MAKAIAPKSTQASARSIHGHQPASPVKAVEMTDQRIIYFMDPYRTKVPQVAVIICMGHSYASSEQRFIDKNNYTHGDKLTGLPDRSNMSICTRSEVLGNTRHITSCSIEGFVTLTNRGINNAEIIKENENQIIEACELYFTTPPAT